MIPNNSINTLSQIYYPQGTILVDIAINDLYFIKSLILCIKDAYHINYFNELNQIASKVQAIKKHLSSSSDAKYGDIRLMIQQEPVNKVLKQINSILDKLRQSFPSQIDQQDIYRLEPDKIQQVFVDFKNLQEDKQYKDYISKSYHQLTVLFILCNNDRKRQKNLLASIASFILPSSTVYQKFDYESMFTMLGIEDNNKPISQQTILLLNSFFSNCWLNRKYLLGIFKQGYLLNQTKQLINSQLTPLRYLQLQVFTGDFERQIGNSKNFDLEVNKTSVVGEYKVSDNNYEMKINQLQPYSTDCIFFTPICNQYRCLLQEGQSINLKYAEKTKEYLIHHDDMTLKVILHLEKEVSQKKKQQQISLDEIDVDNQSDGATMLSYSSDLKETEAETFSQPLTTNEKKERFQSDRTDDLEQIRQKEVNMKRLSSEFTSFNSETMPFFYYFNYKFKVIIQLFKGVKSAQEQNKFDFTEIKQEEADTEQDHKFICQLSNKAVYQFQFNKQTKQLSVEQIFNKINSNLAQQSFLLLPKNQPFQIQKNIIIFSQINNQYQLIF